MAFSIEVNHQHNLVIVKLWARLDSRGFEDYLLALEQMGPFDHPFRLLVVLEEQLQIETSIDEIRFAAKRREEFPPDAQRVIVAPGGTLFGLSRLYSAEVLNDAIEFSVFDNITDALAILCIESTDINLTFPG